MESFVPTKQHLREVMLSNFIQKKTAAETYRFLLQIYGEQNTCEYWFWRFKNNDFDVSDKERVGAPNKFEDEKLEALLSEDPCQTEEELALTLEVTQENVSKRLKKMGMAPQLSYWVPHELTERQQENRKTMCEILL